MKPFDWIVLIIAIPLFIAYGLGRLAANQHELVKAGMATPKTTVWHVLIPFFAILFEVWRIWG